MEVSINRDENEVNNEVMAERSEERIKCGTDLVTIEKSDSQTDAKTDSVSGPQLIEDDFNSNYFPIKDDNKSQDKSKAKVGKSEFNTGCTDDSWDDRANDASNVSPNNDKKGDNYSQIYNSYYANYYQHCGVKSVYSEADPSQSKDIDPKPRPMDLINKALAKQQLGKNRNDNKGSTLSEVTKADEDVEEGQIPSSPRVVNKVYSSSSTPSKASSPSTPLDSSPRNSQYNSSKSMSRSVSKERLMKSRSRSRSRRRYISRSRSRSLSRQRRRRSRSRSPYLGPIIKDYRRGRRGFVRYPRGFRDRGMRSFRRAHNSHHFIPYGFSRRHEFSRSRSRSLTPPKAPKRRQVDVEESDVNSDEKQFDPKRSETLKPSDINMSQKRITQSFLAMLEEKQNRSKMVPIESNRSFESLEAEENFNKQHGFVNTFNTVREMDARKHTLSYDLEREGWQVIDDANSESAPKRHLKNREEDRYDDKFKDLDNSNKVNQREQIPIPEIASVRKVTEESSSGEETSKKKKKKTKKRKKKRKRKDSSSSDSSDSESDNENTDGLDNINTGKKKTKKKKKKSSKKKKKVVSSSSSSENDDKEEKHKKKKRKNKKKSSSESESEEKVDETLSSASNQKLIAEESEKIGSISSIPSEISKDGSKTKDKKKKKRKEDTSDSSDSDSKNEKKKKKKNKKKKSKKRRHRSSSSSSSSESSDSSESGDRKKKKRKKSKKSKKSKKHKKDKKSEKKEKHKLNNEEKKKSKQDEECKQSEFVTVYSVGDPPLELKWPKKLIKYTVCEPLIQYSTNPKVPFVENDFRQIKDERNKIIDEMQRKRKFVSEFGSDNDSDVNNFKKDDSNEKLASEYERFIDELNPTSDLSISHDSLALEIKMREKLLKQFHNSSNNDFEEHSLVTPSEKRAIERMKRHHQIPDENEDHRAYDDLTSAPLNTYYSVRKHKNEDSEPTNSSAKTSNKSSESEPFHKTNEISISIGERVNKHESHTVENSAKVDDKKKTARELLERVKQKKHSTKESESRDDSHNKKRVPHIGKIKKPLKKSPLPKSTKTSSITTANADSTQNTYVSQPMKLDLNYDYEWYYNYYLNSYAMGQYSAANSSSLAAAYYAQYAMLTNYEYKPSDLSNWMEQRGYTLDNTGSNYVMTGDQQIIKTNEELINSNENENQLKTEENLLESNKVESYASESIPADVSFANSEAIQQKVEVNDSETIPIQENVDNTQNQLLSQDFNVDVNKVLTTESSLNSQQNIEVVVSSLQSSITLDQLNSTESKNETESSPNMSPFSSAKFKHKVKVRVTTSSQNDLESESCVSPPPPPPPPMRPQMTSFTSTEPITLPNGEVLPSGTKQIVVHPYPSNDSMKYTADWYYNAFNAHNSTAPANSASETQGVVKAN